MSVWMIMHHPLGSITTHYRWVLMTDEIRNITKIVVEFHCVLDEIQNILTQNILTLNSALESQEWPWVTRGSFVFLSLIFIF